MAWSWGVVTLLEPSQGSIAWERCRGGHEVKQPSPSWSAEGEGEGADAQPIQWEEGKAKVVL